MATVHRATPVVAEAAPRSHQRIWPLIAGVVLALHGAIHLMGVAVDWQMAHLPSLPYRTTALGGHLDLGTTGTQILGVLWLLAALGFIVAGAGLVRLRRPWSAGCPLAGVAAVACLSLNLCVLAWPDSAFGALIDAAILITLTAVAWPRHVA